MLTTKANAAEVVPPPQNDTTIFIEAPTDRPRKRGRKPTTFWPSFTTAAEPYHLTHAICRHCLNLVSFHKKWEQAKNHLMRCKAFKTFIETIEVEELPEWYVAELQRRQEKKRKKGNQPVQSVDEPQSDACTGEGTAISDGSIATATRASVEKESDKSDDAAGSGAKLLKMEQTRLDDAIALHYFSTAQSFTTPLKMPYMEQVIKSIRKTAVQPDHNYLMTTLLDRAYASTQSRVTRYLEKYHAPICLTLDTCPSSSKDELVMNYFASIDKKNIFLESVQFLRTNDDAWPEWTANDIGRVIEKQAYPVVGCVMIGSTENRRVWDLLVEKYPTMFFYGCMRTGLLNLINNIFVPPSTWQVYPLRELSAFAAECVDLVEILHLHRFSEVSDELSMKQINRQYVQVGPTRLLTVGQCYRAILEAEAFLDIDMMSNEIFREQHGYIPNVAHLSDLLENVRELVSSQEFIRNLQKYLAILKPIDRAIRLFGDSNTLISEVYPAFIGLSNGYEENDKLKADEKIFIQKLVNQQHELLYSHSHTLAYLLDPVYVGELFSPDMKMETETILMSFPHPDGTPRDDAAKEALYLQYTDFQIIAWHFKSNNADSFVFKMLKERKKSPLQYWLTDGSKWPELQEIACRVFAMAPSTVDSAQTFRACEFSITKLRQQVDSKVTEKIAYIKTNTRAISDIPIAMKHKESTPVSGEMTGGERMHSTVRLNRYSLQFEDDGLEESYQASIHKRKKALWLRLLIPAATAHLLFGVGDSLEHPVEYLQVTLPARLLLLVLQISMFVLVQWDLVLAHERTMLLVSISNGVPTLLLYTLQRPSLHQWDALFVILGLSFYTIPKITPLGFVSCFVGSWLTAILYLILAFIARPPPLLAESVLGFLYIAPVIIVFNTISYYSEYNSRERFVLRRRLSHESITLAVACTNTLVSLERTDRFLKTLGGNSCTGSKTFLLGVLLWGVFTLGGWTSLPETFKFVDEETGWAWFSHCAGVTVFLLVMTRQLLWLMVVPVVGSVVLWMMTLTMSSQWIIISAHSVGYGLLVASVVVAMGVFSWFVCAWKELVSFLTRSCFLYPQLQAGLEQEFPLLDKIVSEYTAGFDPAILSSRMPTATTKPRSSSVAIASTINQEAGEDDGLSSNASSSRPSRRRSTGTMKEKFMTNKVAITTTKQQLDGKVENTQKLVRHGDHKESCSFEEHERERIVSVLPSLKAGKCFFCSKDDAVHFVPACGMWGKWTHWRMNQQLGITNLSLSSTSSSTALTKPVVTMCTSYYDLQNQKVELEVRLKQFEDENYLLKKQITQLESQEKRMANEAIQLKAEMRDMEEKHALELQRRDAKWQATMDDLLRETNRTAHQRKLELKQLHSAQAALQKQANTSHRQADEASARVQEIESRNKQQQEQIAQLMQELDALKNEVETLRSNAHSPSSGSQLDLSFSSISTCSASSPVANIRALQPSRRLPYAQSLEIEGLRESSRKSRHDVDYSEPWRYLMDNGCNDASI